MTKIYIYNLKGQKKKARRKKRSENIQEAEGSAGKEGNGKIQLLEVNSQFGSELSW